jgi:gliding motility-associatede transport system auxiliary component
MSDKSAPKTKSAWVFLQPYWEKLVGCAANLGGRTLAWGGLALAAIILLSVNLLSSISLRGVKADLTEDQLFTISAGTRTVLTAIDEPIKTRLYFSRRLGEAAPSYARYYERVRTLLEQYRDISGGRLELQVLDPEPFSDAEDRAVAAGLRGVRYNSEGDTGYFGLVATNATDNQETIAFFSSDRESFVEYDITKLIHTLANPKKRVVGLITGLPLDGGKSPMNNQPTPAWMIMSQIREFFEVETLEQTLTEIPENVDVLMVAQPTGLTQEAAYAIDQYVLKGGKLLAFIDPLSEAAQFQMMKTPGTGRAELAKLLKTWGVEFVPKTVATDIANARRVQFGGRGGKNMVTEYVAWLGLTKKSIDQSDVVSSGVDILNLGSAGVLKNSPGAGTKVMPLLRTSADAMEVPSSKAGRAADPVALIRNYQPGGKSLMLAARISGTAKSAFPKGLPETKAEKKDEKDEPSKTAEPESPSSSSSAEKKTDATAKPADDAAALPKGHLSIGGVNVIVVADSDLLADQFWVEAREMLGQRVLTPHAHNSAFVLGALENLTGSDALIALRGRGVKERRFTLVDSLRRDAERQFREKEQALTQKLANVEQELKKLEQAGEGGSVLPSEAERAAIERFRAEMLSTRRELRNVKLALRRDIDSLDGWLKFANIALVPLIIGFGGLMWSLWPSRRSKTSTR